MKITQTDFSSQSTGSASKAGCNSGLNSLTTFQSKDLGCNPPVVNLVKDRLIDVKTVED